METDGNVYMPNFMRDENSSCIISSMETAYMNKIYARKLLEIVFMYLCL